MQSGGNTDPAAVSNHAAAAWAEADPRVAVIGYALTGPMLIDEPTGALLFGANTEANRKRFWESARRCCTIQPWRESGRFPNPSFMTPRRRTSACRARPSG